MFKGQDDNPKLKTVMDELGITPEYNPEAITSDTIVIHNPSFLKFNESLHTRFICNRLIAVAHENFLRPNGEESFDVSKCLSLISQNTLARQFFLAPVSGYNRGTVERWSKTSDVNWKIADFDWFNICDFEMCEPTSNPTDRRGRHSRAGFEKFPNNETMLLLFPQAADYCGMLGADSLIADSKHPKHWDLYKFQEVSVSSFLEKIDFFVYYTHPNLQESFGRVIAEAIAAGKVVITDSLTAQTFGSAVIASPPEDVDAIIHRFIGDPQAYQDHVRNAQAALERFSAEQFISTIENALNKPIEVEIDFM
ncbi:hypothetical protein A9Q96_00220 [Rhodobacterales bacterium 52_120_T64]|nr:hypothetical protein A9Q96_00220 [Rhodobacterales bacterium 52_120_T64]